MLVGSKYPPVMNHGYRIVDLFIFLLIIADILLASSVKPVFGKRQGRLYPGKNELWMHSSGIDANIKSSGKALWKLRIHKHTYHTIS